MRGNWSTVSSSWHLEASVIHKHPDPHVHTRFSRWARAGGREADTEYALIDIEPLRPAMTSRPVIFLLVSLSWQHAFGSIDDTP